MSLLVVEGKLAAHLALAVKAWRERLRELGVDEPGGLAECEHQYRDAAKRGQNRTEADVDWLDDLARAHTGRMFYSRTEVAAMSGKSEKTIARKIAAGELREGPLGIPRAELDSTNGGHPQ